MTSLLRQQRYASFAVGGVSVGLAYLYAKRLVWKSTADLADRLPGPPSAPIATLERPQIFGTHFKLAAVQHWNARFNSHIAGSSSSEGAQHASSEPPVESVRPGSYPFQRIESYWQGYWESTGSFITPQFALLDTSKPKYYVLDMFPYPSGSGLHVGHPSGYTATDVVARYKRARGYNVLHPMGWDAFGLPAEQYAMATGTHPAASTRANVARFRGQLRRLGLSYDWSRELSTAEPEYYRWTQHAFLSALRRGLAYRREAPVNWCPALGTVLANEEVVQGRSERGSHPVQRLPMKQWTLAITRHAERLLRGLDGLDWDSHVLDMQRNWIGRSEGALVEFEVERGKGERHGPPNVRTLSAFTTRPDTLFGATYVAVAPEHPQALLWTTAGQRRAVDAYVAAAASKSDLERADAAAGKSGVWTGSWVRHPATSELLPLWVADYVLGGVGTGALMGVPSHDLRDAAFAEAFDLPFRAVVEDDAGEGGERPSSSPSPSAGPRTDRVYTGVAGRVKNSRSPEGSLCADGLSVPEAQRAVVAWLQARGRGRPHVQYKLRDWLFARQRYWGEPFPVAYEQLADGSLAEEPAPLPEDSLPLRLPPLSDFRPTGTPEGPLSKLVDWVRTSLPGSDDPPRPALRETSTMPQWAGSCWYFLRFVDPWNATAPADAEAQRYWLPVDLYVGGAEHAVLHLLYARFWQQMLFDAGAATCEEPFRKLVSQGMVLGEVEYIAPCLAAEGADPLLHGSAWDPDAVRPLSPEEEAKSPHATPVRVPAELVRADGAGGFCLASRPDVRVAAKAHKMSKSRGNVVSPDEVVASHGADSLRLYVLFMGPLRENKAWSAAGVEGVHRFLSRFWRLAHASIESWGEMERGEEESSRLEPATPLYQLQAMHRTIAKVTEDIEHLRFNTAIAAQMEWVNAANKWAQPPSRECLEAAVQLLAPFAPHVAEELWRAIGHPVSLHDEPWPAARPELLAARTLTLAVQVQGKARASVQLEAGEEPLTQDAVLRAAMDVPAVKKRVEAAGGVKKVVYVPNKVINIIV